MKITYLGHSGFLIQTEDCSIIFDYYKGEIPPLIPEKPLYVLASHSHLDHFNHAIFSIFSTHPNATYILSDDIREPLQKLCAAKKVCLSPEVLTCINYIAPDETQTFSDLTVKTTASTDLGVSFFLTLNSGKTIFHAGDLNWWTWVGEESKAEFQTMTDAFHKEVSKLRQEHIDIAFLPLDPRQQERFFWGFNYYMEQLDIAAAFPMHFWNKPKTIDQLLKLGCAQKYSDRVHGLCQSGECCSL